jgi:hypothetical protein
LTVLIGFAPTLYLRAFFDVPTELPRVWIQGVVLTTWYVAFWSQAALIATNRVTLHRRLGWLVAAIALGAVVTSVYVTLARADTLNPRTVWSNLANAAAFMVFAAAAIAMRRNTATHKRLMLLASIAFVQPAVARFFMWPPFSQLGVAPLVGGLSVSLLFLVPLVVHDLTQRKKLHAATLIGGAALIAARLLAVFVLRGSAWGQSVLRWFA